MLWFPIVFSGECLMWSFSDNRTRRQGLAIGFLGEATESFVIAGSSWAISHKSPFCLQLQQKSPFTLAWSTCHWGRYSTFAMVFSAQNLSCHATPCALRGFRAITGLRSKWSQTVFLWCTTPRIHSHKVNNKLHSVRRSCIIDVDQLSCIYIRMTSWNSQMYTGSSLTFGKEVRSLGKTWCWPCFLFSNLNLNLCFVSWEKFAEPFRLLLPEGKTFWEATGQPEKGNCVPFVFWCLSFFAGHVLSETYKPQPGDLFRKEKKRRPPF